MFFARSQTEPRRSGNREALQGDGRFILFIWNCSVSSTDRIFPPLFASSSVVKSFLQLSIRWHVLPVRCGRSRQNMKNTQPFSSRLSFRFVLVCLFLFKLGADRRINPNISAGIGIWLTSLPSWINSFSSCSTVGGCQHGISSHNKLARTHQFKHSERTQAVCALHVSISKYWQNRPWLHLALDSCQIVQDRAPPVQINYFSCKDAAPKG